MLDRVRVTLLFYINVFHIKLVWSFCVDRIKQNWVGGYYSEFSDENSGKQIYLPRASKGRHN